jgi:peptidyl-prolyl cis-trans isomerase SurA
MQATGLPLRGRDGPTGPARAACAVLAALLLLIAAALPVSAQSNPFRPVIFVNDKVVTAWELDQRERILRLFRNPGDPAETAREQLVDERLQLGAAEALGVTVPPEAIEEGMAEFAGRAELELDAFLAALAQQGVAAETFRDFVRAGLSWREVIRTRFGPRAQVTEAEVDRALALTSRQGGAQALLSEIILPARTPQEQAEAERLADELSRNLRGETAFANAARQVSAAPTAPAGGRIPDPVPLASLPEGLRAQVLTLSPGEVSEPVPLGGAIALFLLRELRDTGLAAPDAVSVEYARYLIPNGGTEGARAEARRVAERVDTCDDLFGINKGQPAERLTIETRSVAELPPEIAVELARLDEGETSAAIVRGDTLVMLMLCGRTELTEEDVDRAAIRRQLIDQRLSAYADGYLAELRADALIRTP